ncbi:hypothetical protein RND71_008674 [Anisodus tanguticus]|uniref:EF-hand domain-containing protein n=1 Tax=Anisodus tanguticus TaxID=243964 RepID=A0AAE1SNR4_9SOLA|nr:hypothetical protein RND71_008674 [Anisodus tanguticus]
MMTTTLKSDQLKQLKDIFMRFDLDLDGDGSLTQLELAALLRSLGLKPGGDQLHVLLAKIDNNGNGSIAFDELVNAIMPGMNEDILMNQDQLMELFRSFDRDVLAIERAVKPTVVSLIDLCLTSLQNSGSFEFPSHLIH